jgi:predicted NBD/HSP70 family sugar kinase
MKTVTRLGLTIPVGRTPALDPAFLPAAAFRAAYRAAAARHPDAFVVRLALVRELGRVAVWEEPCLAAGSDLDEATGFHFERLLKTLLWLKGGFRVVLSAPDGATPAQGHQAEALARRLAAVYAPGGARAFDADFMAGVYDAPFSVEAVPRRDAPEAAEPSIPVGGHLDGCRIGLDLGGSDRKVSAVVDGTPVYSEEVVWHPKTESDPDYHYAGILDALRTAAAKMPRVDSIGVSAAGIYVDDRAKVASLFLQVPKDAFREKVRDIFLRAAAELGGVPVHVVNDGDVTALAGALALSTANLLGIAMGTSEAAGYVDREGGIRGWLNELAFVPVDFRAEAAPLDEWSGDVGCGVQYFSQDAAIRLAPAAGISLDPALAPGEKLKVLQALHAQGHPGADAIFRAIGIYLGHALVDYASFYGMRHVLVLGRVTSGAGGDRILEEARAVLAEVDPELAAGLSVLLPDETVRRVGQSIAAASL